MSIAPSRVMIKTRSMSILYSGGFRGYSFFSTRLLFLPKNVPKTTALSGRRKLHGLVIDFTRGGGPVTTVYTTPVMLKGLKLLGKHEIAYCPDFRRCLSKTSYAGRPIMESNGVVAKVKPKTTVRFTLAVISALLNGRGIGRLMRTVYMEHWTCISSYFSYDQERKAPCKRQASRAISSRQ